MGLKLSVVAKDKQLAEQWASELGDCVSDWSYLKVAVSAAGDEPGQIIFVDGNSPDDWMEGLDRRGRAVFLVLPEGSDWPKAVSDGVADDVLVYPFRKVEVLAKVNQYQGILAWDEVTDLNASFGEIIDQLHDDLRVAERLQKANLPVRFQQVKGFSVRHRYLAGLKSGGDFCDIADAPDQSRLSLVMTDASSYGLSSAVLATLMRVAVKLTHAQGASVVDTVKLIHDDLQITLGAEDTLSLFYGFVNRADFTLQYVNFGACAAFVANDQGKFSQLTNQGSAITQQATLGQVTAGTLKLEPLDRLVLLSDSFIEAAGGTTGTCELLDKYRGKDPLETLNELTYLVKGKLENAEEFPVQDCTAVVLDADSRVLRLA